MRGTGRRSAGHGEALLNRRGRRVKLASAHDPPQVGQRKPTVQRAWYKRSGIWLRYLQRHKLDPWQKPTFDHLVNYAVLLSTI